MQGSGANVVLTVAHTQIRRAGDPQDVRHRLEAHSLPHQRVDLGQSCDAAAGPEKAVGIISSGYVKDPTDPQWLHTPEYKDWLAWMKKYNTSGDIADANTVYAYSVAQTMVAVLKQCGNNLTRENLMKQAASIHELKLPMLLPGITVSTSASDFAPIKQMQLQRFDGTTWKLFGEVISGTGS